MPDELAATAEPPPRRALVARLDGARRSDVCLALIHGAWCASPAREMRLALAAGACNTVVLFPHLAHKDTRAFA